MNWRVHIFGCVALLSCAAGTCLAGETATLRNGFTIHYERRESLGETTRLFVTDSSDSFVDVPTDEIQQIEVDKTPPATPAPVKAQTPQSVNHHPIQLEEALSAASQKHNVSEDLLRSIVRVESAFNPNARSAKGAQGLMQLMPATAARMGVRDAFNPGQNLDGGAKYLSELLGRYNNNVVFALAAYNAGPERVEKYQGIPPFPETVNYVTRVLSNLESPRQSGARLIAAAPPSQPNTKRSSAPNLEAIRNFQLSVEADSSR